MPFALLEARRYFRIEAHNNPSDSDENECRKLACEALARKIVARWPMEEQYSLLSARYTIIEKDGDESNPLSGELDSTLQGRTGADGVVRTALESAVDQHATFFLSSGEAQRCVFALWRGLLVPQIKEDGTTEYMPVRSVLFGSWIPLTMCPLLQYAGSKNVAGLFSRFDPDRVGVPRYQVRCSRLTSLSTPLISRPYSSSSASCFGVCSSWRTLLRLRLPTVASPSRT